MTAVTWRADRVVTPERTDADTMVTADGRVRWVGRHDDAGAQQTGDVVDLRGTVITPAFVDGHVHATATGIALDGLDLHTARSVADLLDRLAAHARSRPGQVIAASGWDESTWPERRPPTAAEIDAATGGALVYLARADVHSAVVSSALLARCDLTGVQGDAGDGWLKLDAHHVARRQVNAARTADQTRQAQLHTLRTAASLGLGAVHEMAGPEINAPGDLEALLDLAASTPGPVVHAYWGHLGDVETPRRLGLAGAGGDLFCDGSIGSRTAALRRPYDDADTTGSLRFTAEEMAEHIVAAARAGLQSGFHVIGDAALDVTLEAYAHAAATLGLQTLRAGRHRLEHVEMADDAAIARLAAFGITASVQPAFDTAWGGPSLMYAERLGHARSVALNPYAAMHRAGVALAFGSDAPVTPIDPWGMVRGAVHHRTAAARLDVPTAFAAATAGGQRSVGVLDAGVLSSGMRATFAAWETASVDAGWWPSLQTDRADGVPDDAPRCTRTVVDGRTVFDAAGAT